MNEITVTIKVPVDQSDRRELKSMPEQDTWPFISWLERKLESGQHETSWK